MSETHPTATATGRTLLDPTIPTKSLRAVLNIFGTEIGRRQAKGSIGSTNQALIDELGEHGGMYNQEEGHRLDLDDTTTDRRRRGTINQ